MEYSSTYHGIYPPTLGLPQKFARPLRLETLSEAALNYLAADIYGLLSMSLFGQRHHLQVRYGVKLMLLWRSLSWWTDV